MTRTKFAMMVVLLVLYVQFATPYNAIIDYVKRSLVGQAWLFKRKKSKRDGVKKISRHQRGKAIDLYLERKGKLVWSVPTYKKIHKFWSFLGGRPGLSWDRAHFEV